MAAAQRLARLLGAAGASPYPAQGASQALPGANSVEEAIEAGLTPEITQGQMSPPLDMLPLTGAGVRPRLFHDTTIAPPGMPLTPPLRSHSGEPLRALQELFPDRYPQRPPFNPPGAYDAEKRPANLDRLQRLLGTVRRQGPLPSAWRSAEAPAEAPAYAMQESVGPPRQTAEGWFERRTAGGPTEGPPPWRHPHADDDEIMELDNRLQTQREQIHMLEQQREDALRQQRMEDPDTRYGSEQAYGRAAGAPMRTEFSREALERLLGLTLTGRAVKGIRRLLRGRGGEADRPRSRRPDFRAKPAVAAEQRGY